MAKTLQSFLETVASTLEDEGFTTWTIQKLVRYVNDGQRDMQVFRPDLFITTAAHALTPGYRQTLPTDGTKLVTVHGNTTGTRRAVTKVDRALLDLQVRNWRNLTQASEIVHYMYDVREPKSFDVYPPAKSGAAIEIEYSRIPTDLVVPAAGTTISGVSGNLGIPDSQVTALQHYVCFRCYAEGVEEANAARASSFLALFKGELGAESQATVAVAPSTTT